MRRAFQASVVVIAAGAVAVAAACGGNDSSEATTTEAEPTTAEAPLPDGLDLDAANVQLSDLPSGWMEIALDEQDDEDIPCQLDILVQRDDPDSAVRYEDEVSALGSALAVADSEAEATQTIRDIEMAFAGCSTWENGGLIWMIGDTEPVSVGDESFGLPIRIETEGGDGVAEGYGVYFSEGIVEGAVIEVSENAPFGLSGVVPPRAELVANRLAEQQAG